MGQCWCASVSSTCQNGDKNSADCLVCDAVMSTKSMARKLSRLYLVRGVHPVGAHGPVGAAALTRTAGVLTGACTTVTVASLSATGIGFVTRRPLALQVGDQYEGLFGLDDRRQSVVMEAICIQWVEGRLVGATFQPQEGTHPTLTWSLESKKPAGSTSARGCLRRESTRHAIRP